MKLDLSLIKGIAKNIGFDDCGLSKIEISNQSKKVFEKWITIGNNATMSYLNLNQDLRNKPELLVENAKSVISVIFNYYSEDKLDNQKISISKYALGNDYHYILKKKLQKLLDEIKKTYPNINARVFTDSAPVYERFFALNAGLGFLGKNTCLINPKFGSWVFIGEIITDLEIESELVSPINNTCGDCTLCIDACPTSALSIDGLNANKCISYHTIENKGEIPKEIADKITTQIFGCDICQDVCPHNSKAILHNHSELMILPQIQTINLKKIESLSNSKFKQKFQNTSLFRTGKKKLISNLKIIG